VNRIANACTLLAALRGPRGGIPFIGDVDDGRVIQLLPYGDWPREGVDWVLARQERLESRPFDPELDPLSRLEAEWLIPRVPDQPASTPRKSTRITYPTSGLHLLSEGDWQVVFRCGQRPETNDGAHQHNDQLAVTLRDAGQWILVDPGSGTYTRNAELRNRMRSTAVHATISIQGCEQEFLGPGLFRLGSVLRPRLEITGPASLVGEYDGFPKTGLWHRRRIGLDPNGLTIVDEVRVKPGSARAILQHFPLAPDLDVEVAGREARLRRGPLEWILVAESGAEWTIEDARYSPGYGVVIPTMMLTRTLTSQQTSVIRLGRG